MLSFNWHTSLTGAIVEDQDVTQEVTTHLQDGKEIWDGRTDEISPISSDVILYMSGYIFRRLIQPRSGRWHLAKWRKERLSLVNIGHNLTLHKIYDNNLQILVRIWILKFQRSLINKWAKTKQFWVIYKKYIPTWHYA